MEILSPVSAVGEARALAEAGATGFYCGVLSEEWLSKYGAVGSINKREWRACSLAGYSELAKVVKEAHAAKAPVYLTLNQAYYSEPQYALILGEARKAADAGVDAFITADIALMRLLRKEGFKQELHASSICGAMNSRAVEFYRRVGCSRVILPYNMRVDEFTGIARAAKGSGIAVEMFVLNGGCENVDAFCTFHHGVYAQEEKGRGRRITTCRLPFRARVLEANGASPEAVEVARRRIDSKTGLYGLDCGACALWDMREAGIAGVKITGRGNPLEKELKDVRFIKRLMELLDKAGSRTEFISKAAETHTAEYGDCAPKRCYYPGASQWP